MSGPRAPSKTVLVIGSGGREHALGWKLACSPQVARLIVAPGNDGMPAAWERWDSPLKTREDFAGIAQRASEAKVDLVVVGPDNPLADGIVDILEEHGLLAFGPRANAARIEASKAFAKDVMIAARVPTAKYVEAHSVADAKTLLAGLDWQSSGWVIKADGLALGKGVHVCDTLVEARLALTSLEKQGLTGPFLIEQKLQGEEISWLAFCDGSRVALLDPARDYKRVRDQDQGPNTGGMGAFSPIAGLPERLADRVRREVFEPTLQELAKRGAPFRGVLYAGLMVDLERGSLSVLEFNARFGDPETQVLMARLNDDFYRWCEAVAKGDLSPLPEKVPFSREAAVVVIGAAEGYPDAPRKGAGLATQEGLLPENPALCPAYFFAGVSRAGSDWTVSGGRVLGAMGLGATLEQARSQAYERIRKIRSPGLHYRSDIAAVQGAHS
jgi:phosphoribosylamine--glycine ligase